jgi:hypothetical protein
MNREESLNSWFSREGERREAHIIAELDAL